MTTLTPILITPTRADHPDAIQLIQELEDVLDPLYPNESRHGYTVDKLLQQGVHFFILRVGDEAAACGGVQFFTASHADPAYGELKRMFVRHSHRGHGFAKRILQHLSEFTLQHGIRLLRLETGVHQHEAIGLYRSCGFYDIAHFGDYAADPLSLFLEKQLMTDE